MTNRLEVVSVDQFMADYVPTYSPIFPIFVGGKSKQYSAEVGSVISKRLNAVGDLRAKHITPKDTEIKQVQAVIGEKTFKKYFLSNQYTQSEMQSKEGIQGVVSQVLDEHNQHQDDLLFLGEGTAANNVINNGLFWSSDSNYTLESVSGLAAGSDSHLSNFHAAIISSKAKADKVAGKKIVFIYGSSAKLKYNSLYSSTSVPFKEALAKVLGPNYQVVEVPDDVALSGNGYIICNMDQVMFHYSLMPQLKNQGVNEEKGYSWHNFMMGSCMLEVLALYGIIRQPVTFD